MPDGVVDLTRPLGRLPTAETAGCGSAAPSRLGAEDQREGEQGKRCYERYLQILLQESDRDRQRTWDPPERMVLRT